MSVFSPLQMLFCLKLINSLSGKIFESRHEKTCLCPMQTTKVQIRLHICAVSSACTVFAA